MPTPESWYAAAQTILERERSMSEREASLSASETRQSPATAARVLLRDAINAHIEREAHRIGTDHGHPAAVPGGTGYCIPNSVARQIVEKYLNEASTPAPLDVERLTEALDGYDLEGWADRILHSVDPKEEWQALAGGIAAEYARLPAAPAASQPDEALRAALIGLSAWVHGHLTLVDKWSASDVDEVLADARAALAARSVKEEPDA